MVKVRPLLRVKTPSFVDTGQNATKPTEAGVSVSSVTGNKPTRKRPPQKAIKAATVTGNNVASTPNGKRKEKPPVVTGYHWREDGAGWQLRREIYEAGKRRFIYVGHLSKSAYREMKRAHKGNGFGEALADWIAEKEQG